VGVTDKEECPLEPSSEKVKKMKERRGQLALWDSGETGGNLTLRCGKVVSGFTKIMSTICRREYEILRTAAHKNLSLTAGASAG